jgi:hypothetical protein
VRRHLLGLLALASLLAAAITAWVPALLAYQPVAGVGLRIGAVLGVLWLAWPDLDRLPGWLWYVLPLGLVAMFFAKGLLWFFIPTIVTATFIYITYRKVWRSPRR